MSRQPFRPRDYYRIWCPITTRWADNDAYGHVNNVVYYSWFDTAVNNWLIAQGMLDVSAGEPIGLVAETGCRYAKPLTFPEPVELGMAVERIGKTSVRYALGVFSQYSSEAAAEGFFVHVYVGRESRRPLELPFEWRQKLATIAA